MEAHNGDRRSCVLEIRKNEVGLRMDDGKGVMLVNQNCDSQHSSGGVFG